MHAASAELCSALHAHARTCDLACNGCCCCARAQEAGITELLLAPGKLADQLPGCSGTRNLSDNLSDLKAQVSPRLSFEGAADVCS